MRWGLQDSRAEARETTNKDAVDLYGDLSKQNTPVGGAHDPDREIYGESADFGVRELSRRGKLNEALQGVTLEDRPGGTEWSLQ